MLKEQRSHRVRAQSSLLMLILLLGLSACKLRGTNLPFETIEQKDWAGTGQAHEAREPGLMVIAQAEDVATLDTWVTEDAKTRLQALDYDIYFALIVFQGWKPTTGYGVQVEKVTRQRDTVTIYARFQDPKADEPVGGAVTSPYHLVQVQKTDGWGRDIVFNLVVDDTVFSSVAQYVP